MSAGTWRGGMILSDAVEPGTETPSVCDDRLLCILNDGAGGRRAKAPMMSSDPGAGPCPSDP